MSAARTAAAAFALGTGFVLGARPCAAQPAARASARPTARDSAADTARDTARDTAGRRAPGPPRLSVALHYGTFRPAGGGQLFALLDRALAPGGGALRPRMLGGELRADVTPRWRVLAGVEGGGRTMASVSRATPAAAPSPVGQHTALAVTSAQYVGAEWQALRWRGRGRDRARLVVGGGFGSARYELRQWGDFVDADRRVAFAQDFRSAGRGGVRYLSAAAEVPLAGGVTLSGTARRQAGSAPMTADYASFDRLDLGGTRLYAGLRVRPAAGARGR